MSGYVIGIDGGGTKTVSILVSTDGTIISRKVGDSSNLQVIGPAKLQSVLKELVVGQLQESQVQKDKVHILYAGLAGAGRASDRETIHKLLTELSVANDVVVDTDASAALAGAFLGGPGIILIAGTGAICFGKTESGELIRSGGWGYMLGDEGSGFFIGQQAIMAALKDLDGRGQKTNLREAIEKKYSLNRIDEIIPRIYSGAIDRTEIASLAIVVFEVAAQGDRVAQQIVELAGSEQGNMIAAVATKMGMTAKTIDVALIGSVFKQKQVLTPALESAALKVVHRINLLEPPFEPAVGSAILALIKSGITINNVIIKNLKSTSSFRE